MQKVVDDGLESGHPGGCPWVERESEGPWERSWNCVIKHNFLDLEKYWIQRERDERCRRGGRGWRGPNRRRACCWGHDRRRWGCRGRDVSCQFLSQVQARPPPILDATVDSVESKHFSNEIEGSSININPRCVKLDNQIMIECAEEGYTSRHCRWVVRSWEGRRWWRWPRWMMVMMLWSWSWILKWV